MTGKQPECKVRAPHPEGNVYRLLECNEERRVWESDLGLPCFLGSRAPMEQQEEEEENVLLWKQEEGGVPRERE